MSEDRIFRYNNKYLYSAHKGGGGTDVVGLDLAHAHATYIVVGHLKLEGVGDPQPEGVGAEEMVGKHPEPEGAGGIVTHTWSRRGCVTQREVEGVGEHHRHPEPEVGVHLHPEGDEVGAGHLQVPGHLFTI